MSSPATVNPKGVFAHINIDWLFESKTNPRKHYDAKDDADLANSARTHGIIEPLIVRAKGEPHGKRFEIIAGSRRYRAAKSAKLETVPCSVRELDDRTVLEFQLIENSQRSDIHPLEEGEGFNRLLALEGYTPEILAEKTGHELGYIFKRRQLTRLIPSFQKLFLENKINIGHAHALAKLAEGSQIAVEKAKVIFSDDNQVRMGDQWIKGEKTAHPVKHLEAWIAQHILLDLSTSPWKKDDAKLLPAAGACTNCPKRSSANKLLFDDMPKGERCLDRSCFEAKLQAFISDAEAKAVAAGKPLVRISARGWADDKELKALQAVSSRDYALAKKKCPSTERAIIVHGTADIGHQRDICRDSKCKIHHEFGMIRNGNAPPTNTFDQLWKKRKDQLPSKIDEATRCAVFDMVMETYRKNPGVVLPDPQLRILGDYIARKFNGTDVPELMGVTIDEKQARDTYNGKLLLAHMETIKGGALQCFVFGLSLVEGAKEYCYKEGDEYQRLQMAAETFGVDWNKLQKIKAKELQTDFDDRFARAKERRAKLAGKKPKAKGKAASK